MKKGKDTSSTFKGLYLVHQNIPGKEVELHSHDEEHILFIPLQGEITVTTETAILKCGPGRTIYIPNKTLHKFESSQHQGERLIAMLKNNVWKKNASGGLPSRLFPTSQLCNEILFYLLLNPKTKHSGDLINVLVQTISENMEMAVGAIEHLEAKGSEPRLQKALMFLRDNVGEEDISMGKAAQSAGLSLRSLNRLCLEQLGTSPKNIFIQYRIEKAQELLSQQMSVTEAAFAVGYNSLASFISAFRKVTGQLPSDMRKFLAKNSKS